KGCLTSTTSPISKVQKWERKVTRQVTCLTIWTFHWT
ncbi:mltA-interacting MipA family protein, partial [Vibrio parahaemolyticus V-223/04]